MTGHIFLEGEIGNDVTVKTVRRDISLYPHANEWIIHINSIGGDVYEGYQIGNIFKSLDNTTAHIGAMCASIATYAATCCNQVKMNVHGDFMIHLPTGTLSGNAEDLRKAAVQLDRIKAELINQYMTKVGGKLTIEQLSDMIEVETSMSPQEALKNGFIDSVEEKLKAVAKLDIQKLKNMEGLTKEEAKGLFANLGEKIDNLFKKVRNSVELALADGTMIMSSAENVESLVGSTVTDANGSPLAAGAYETADAFTITVVDGGIVEKYEPVTVVDKDETSTLKEEIAKLKEQLSAQSKVAEDLTAQAVKEKAAIKSENEKIFKALKADLEELKNRTLGDANPPLIVPKKDQEPAGIMSLFAKDAADIFNHKLK